MKMVRIYMLLPDEMDEADMLSDMQHYSMRKAELFNLFDKYPTMEDRDREIISNAASVQVLDMREGKRLKFGALKVGEHFIGWPQDSSYEPDKGLRGHHRLFVKVNEREAHNGRGIVSTMPETMDVIRVILD